jgi:hypothetical protein
MPPSPGISIARPAGHHAPQRQPHNEGGGTKSQSPIPHDGDPKRKRAPRGTFDRNTYQRELMRKRRADGKA